MQLAVLIDASVTTAPTWRGSFGSRPTPTPAGGSLENRTRFGKEVVAAVRAAVPDDFIVCFRMSLEGGFVGPTAAAALAGGWTVTSATPLPILAGEVDGTLIRFVHERLATVQPRVITDVRLLADPGPDVTLEHVLTGAVIALPEPGIVAVAGHREAANTLRRELRAAAPDLDMRLAGDAHAPRNFDAATAEGALVGAAIV